MRRTDERAINLTVHRDHTITYWSVYHQMWVRRAAGIPDEELAAMSDRERRRAIGAVIGWLPEPMRTAVRHVRP